MKTIGDHIRKRRLHLGLLQRQAADLIGVDKATVHNWERGHAAPNLRAMPAVLRFLGVDRDPSLRLEGTLAARVRAARRARGLSIEELARTFGVDLSTVRKWEHSESVPLIRFLPRIAAFVGNEDSPPVDASLGNRLRGYRRQHGLTQRELAEQIGVHQGTLSDWELGKHPPCIRLLRTLEKFLCTDP